MNFDYETEEDIAMKSSEVARKKGNVPIFLISSLAAILFLYILAKILSHVTAFDINKAKVKISAKGSTVNALEITDCTSEIKDGKVMVYAKIRNRGSSTLIYGEPYKLMKKGNLKVLNKKDFFESIGNLLEKGKTASLVFYCTKANEAGAFRLEKEFSSYIDGKAGEDKSIIWIEFELY